MASQRMIDGVADSKKNVKRKRYFDNLDILECPTCMEEFSPPIYQCTNGHSICSTCCPNLPNGCPECSLPTGTIRNLLAEHFIESLLTKCKHSGCSELLKQTGIAHHEATLCPHKPYLCPFPSCTHEASQFTLPHHLTTSHEVKTVALVNHNNGSKRAAFPMEAQEGLLVVEGEGDAKFIVHRVVKDAKDTFFCTTFGEGGRNVKWHLSVVQKCKPTVPFLLVGAEMTDLRRVNEKGEAPLYGGYLVVTHLVPPAEGVDRSVGVVLRVTPAAVPAAV